MMRESGEGGAGPIHHVSQSQAAGGEGAGLIRQIKVNKGVLDSSVTT